MSWLTKVGSLYSFCSSQIVISTYMVQIWYIFKLCEGRRICVLRGRKSDQHGQNNTGEQSRRRNVVCKTTLFRQWYFVVRAAEDLKRRWFLKKRVSYFSISTLYRTKLLILKKKHNITHTKDLIYHLKSCN